MSSAAAVVRPPMLLLTVFTTTATRDEAQRIATALVCADPEWRLMLKTTAARDADDDGAAL